MNVRCADCGRPISEHECPDKTARLTAIAQSVIDEATDGIDRSQWRLTAALALLGPKQKEPAQ